MAKAKWQLKDVKLTSETEAWIDAEIEKHPEKTPQQVVREQLHEIALRDIHAAKLLVAAVSRREIRGDEG